MKVTFYAILCHYIFFALDPLHFSFGYSRCRQSKPPPPSPKKKNKKRVPITEDIVHVMSPCQTFYNFNQCSVKLVKTLYPPMCQSSSVTLKHFPLSRHWILLYRTALFIAAIKCQNS